MNRFVSPRWIYFLAVALFFLSGHRANADPVGDFFKKLGQSISKAFQPQPTAPTNPEDAGLSASGSQESNVVETGPSAPEESPSLLRKRLLALCCRLRPRLRKRQEEICPTEFPSQAGKACHKSLFTGGKLHRYQQFAPGSAVKDPYTGKIFRVP